MRCCSESHTLLCHYGTCLTIIRYNTPLIHDQSSGCADHFSLSRPYLILSNNGKWTEFVHLLPCLRRELPHKTGPAADPKKLGRGFGATTYRTKANHYSLSGLYLIVSNNGKWTEFVHLLPSPTKLGRLLTPKKWVGRPTPRPPTTKSPSPGTTKQPNQYLVGGRAPADIFFVLGRSLVPGGPLP